MSPCFFKNKCQLNREAGTECRLTSFIITWSDLFIILVVIILCFCKPTETQTYCFLLFSNLTQSLCFFFPLNNQW